MQLNKVLKGLMIALPVLAVTACSSSDKAADASASQQTNQEQTTDATVATPLGADTQLTEQELKEQQLRETQTVYFAFDNSTISSEYEDMLAAHAAFISKDPSIKVKIEGHADERGTPEYNIALGERRAKAVAKYLQALGVQADQIEIKSYGEERPLLLGQTDEVYAKNRRAVLVY